MTWLGNDSLAKLQLKQTAELFRMTHHEHFVGNYGYVHGLSLKQRQVRGAAPGHRRLLRAR